MSSVSTAVTTTKDCVCMYSSTVQEAAEQPLLLLHSTIQTLDSEMEFLSALELNEPRFLSLLTKLIGESKYLQNNPAQGLIPQEKLAADHILEVLKPYTKENGGVLEVEFVSFVEGRGNVIIKYPGTTSEVVSFVGSHLDVVPADPTNWDRDPFSLTIEGDVLYGRGTTDCLGHCALLTDLMATLAEKRPPLKTSVVVILIANEENGTLSGIGVDQLAKEGYMDSLKGGPLFWIDAADSQPCIGTAGAAQWQLKVTGKLFHSGLPHKGINAIEMAMDAVSYVQKKFFNSFPRHPMEDTYSFMTQSTMKPTQISCTPGGLNQIPPECTVQGDIRFAPFYDSKDIARVVESSVAEINADPSVLEGTTERGPHSKYTLPEQAGKVELKWLTSGENGVACKLDSKGYFALVKATENVLGVAKPYSIGGSLPLIRDLQEEGFDVQISGYGASSKLVVAYFQMRCAYLFQISCRQRISQLVGLAQRHKNYHTGAV